MGSLLGHIVPGTAFGLLAVWWTINLFLKHFENLFRRRCRQPAVMQQQGKGMQGGKQQQPNSRHHTRQKQQCYSPIRYRPTYRDHGGSRCPPWETLVRLFAVLVGMGGEYVTALDSSGRFVAIHNGQHMTMFGFFLFPVLFDLMHYYRVPGLPPNLDLVSGALAFGVEGVLFAWHLHGRTHLDVQVRTKEENAHCANVMLACMRVCR